MKKIEPLDFYLMRIPAFPINKLMDLNKIMDSNPSNDNTDKYITYFLEPFFLKAIYLSSKVLYKELIKFKNNELEDPKKKKKLVNSLYKYYVRMCTRPTPYGLFAGYFFGNAEDGETDIIINNDNLNPIINLDMAYLSHLQSFLIKNNNDIRFNEIFYSNNTLYALNNKFRYVNFTNSSGEKKYFLNEVSYSEMLEYIIDISKNGMTLNELLDNLSNNVDGGTNEQFQQYLNELINFNILVFEEINIYSEDNPGKQFYNRYKNFINVESIGNIKNLESNFSLKKIIKKEKELENLSKTKFKNYFNLTLNINTKSNRISSKVLDEISRNISDLKHLKNKTTPEDLLNFRKKFYKKYGSKEVPLNEALDFDIGLGYGLQVSENITEFPIINNVYSPKSKINTKYDLNLLKFLDKRLKDCLINNLYTIELDSNDIQEIKKRGLESEDHVENSYIMGAILSKSYKELDNGNYYFLAKTNMPSPYMGSLLARFDYVDKIGTNRIKNHLKKNIDKVYAEIVFNPGGRLSNVLFRPQYYDYYIDYGASQNYSENKRTSSPIFVEDLLVSINNDRVILKSKKLNKEVIPRLTSAHNFANEGLPLYRFLCDLQYQKVNTGYFWSWSFFSYYDFLPRVTYKKIIISPAQWKLKKNELINFDKKIEEISKKSKYCYLGEGDNELALDLENEFCIEMIKNELKKSDLILYEYLNFNSPIRSSNLDKYTSEIIIPFKNTHTKDNPINSEKIVDKPNFIKRHLYPNDKWIYFKVFLSFHVLDELLINNFKKIIESKIKDEEISAWFFVRYNDPESHLRIRFLRKNITADKLTEDILEACKDYLNNGLISDFSINTYERELERYGYDLITCAEELFYKDSETVIELLDQLQSVSDTTIKEKIAILNVDKLLDDFKLNVNEKLEIMTMMSSNFLGEFIDWDNKEKSSSYLKKTLDIKLRERKDFLETAIFNKQFDEVITRFIKILNKRSKNTSSNIKEIEKKYFDQHNKKNDIISSIIHMSLNRLLEAKHRKQEMVIYYLLKKTYNSILKRND